MTSPALSRRLGLRDAVVIGLAAMIGTGVFSAFAPAAAAAGSGLVVALLVAGVVALGNATSTAQLAAVHPTSGGVYAYGRAELGHWWGFLAGWGFVIGKTASCAAMALTAAAYLAPPGWERPVAIVAAVLLGSVNLFGITRTAALARALLIVTLLSLAVVAVAGTTAFDPERLWGDGVVTSGPLGILQAAGLLFFAFAGYARIATLGEEVRDPARTIPRAIAIAFAAAFAVYAILGVLALAALGADGLAAARAPLVATVQAAGWDAAAPLVRIGAAAASLGALLALIAGVGRTVFAMARAGDLPHPLAAVDARRQVPHRAEILVVAVVVVICALGDIRGAIGFSSFGVLLYYLVANVAAFRQRDPARRYPRALQVVGAAGCVALIVTLPWPSLPMGAAVLLIGAGYRVLRLRRRRS